MKITAISAQVRNPDRVNVSVDGKYRFSLDLYQVTDLGIKVGKEYSEQQLQELEEESVFGKLYARTLEYTLMRPHSEKEIRDYLWRKTRTTKVRSRRTGEMKERPGVSQSVADRVLVRLKDKGYVDDEEFARYWYENRSQAKGVSLRKLQNELRAKGVDSSIIERCAAQAERNDHDELRKVIDKKARRYPDEEKLIAYLLRQGFRYDDIRQALADDYSG